MLLLVAKPDLSALREWRRKQFRTQEEIAGKLGISRGYWATLEKGIQEFPEHLFKRISELGFGQTASSQSESMKVVQGIKMRAVPITGNTSAGKGVASVDFESETLYAPEIMLSDDSEGLIADGDSMMNAIHHGDTLIVRKFDRLQTNKTYVFRDQNGESMVKKAKWKNGLWNMHSLNPIYEDKPLLDYQVVAIVTGIFRYRDGQIYMLSNYEGLTLPENDE